MVQINFLDKLRKSVVKNSPTILTVFGGVGAVASVILASDAAVQAKENLENARTEKRKKEGDEQADISTPDKIAIYAKAYTPTFIMLIATELCIYGSNRINQKRLATLAGAYILTETNFKEYKEQVENMVGEKKAQEIKDNIIQKHVDENPASEINTTENHLPNATQLGLWYDETSGRYWYSNAEYIRKAEIEANAMLQKNDFVSLNDVYELLGLDPIPLGDDMGWSTRENDEVTITIGAALMGPDIPVGTILMEVHPSNGWLSAL